jgi:SHS2 domain-containing protein
MTRKTNDHSWRLLDHTADIRVEVLALALEELFVNAALALADLLDFPRAASGETRTASIRLEADCGEELLIDWLREILYKAEVEGFALEDAAVVVSEGEPGHALRVQGELSGRVLPPGLGPRKEIKAVTYHGAVVEKVSEGYRAEFICDV